MVGSRVEHAGKIRIVVLSAIMPNAGVVIYDHVKINADALR
jgi:hypothetical protein